MDNELKKEEQPLQPPTPENDGVQKDKLIEEINQAKDVSPETLDEEQEEIRRSLKQG